MTYVKYRTHKSFRNFKWRSIDATKTLIFYTSLMSRGNMKHAQMDPSLTFNSFIPRKAALKVERISMCKWLNKLMHGSAKIHNFFSERLDMFIHLFCEIGKD